LLTRVSSTLYLECEYVEPVTVRDVASAVQLHKVLQVANLTPAAVDVAAATQEQQR
jgi:hypothetical protein